MNRVKIDDLITFQFGMQVPNPQSKQDKIYRIRKELLERLDIFINPYQLINANRTCRFKMYQRLQIRLAAKSIVYFESATTN